MKTRRSSPTDKLLRMAPWGAAAGLFVFFVLFTVMGSRGAFSWAGSVACVATYLIYWFSESEASDISLVEYFIAVVVMSLGGLVFGLIGALIWPN